MAKSLSGTKTHQNLKDAFAGESQANRRYLYFAKVADIEGLPEIAGNFKETADGETGHAHGHLDTSQQVGDPATGLPIGATEKNLKAADRRRDPRVRDDVPGHGEVGPRRGLRRHRRVVRDAREGREEPRRPLPEDARHPEVSTSSRSPALPAGRGPGWGPEATGWVRGGARSVRSVGAVFRSRREEDQPEAALPPANDPNDWRFWDEARPRRQEARRVFEVCHGCRMCVGYCGSFPDMFARVDRDIEKRGAEGAELLDDADFRLDHRPLLAVQALLHQVPLHGRSEARVAHRRPAPAHADEGAERATARRDAAGPGARRARQARRDDERADGAPRQLRERQSPRAEGEREGPRDLGASSPSPSSRTEPFAKWLARHEKLPEAGNERHRRALRDVHRRLQQPVRPRERRARARAERLRRRAPRADSAAACRTSTAATSPPRRRRPGSTSRRSSRRSSWGGKIVVIQPTCSYMIKKEYPELLGTRRGAQGRRAARST